MIEEIVNMLIKLSENDAENSEPALALASDILASAQSGKYEKNKRRRDFAAAIELQQKYIDRLSDLLYELSDTTDYKAESI